MTTYKAEAQQEDPSTGYTIKYLCILSSDATGSDGVIPMLLKAVPEVPARNWVIRPIRTDVAGVHVTERSIL